MAQDGLIFRWLGGVHESYQTPHRAIFAQAIWSSILVATGTYRALFTRVVYTEWIFFGLMAIGLFILRRRPVGRLWIPQPILGDEVVLQPAQIQEGADVQPHPDHGGQHPRRR